MKFKMMKVYVFECPDKAAAWAKVKGLSVSELETLLEYTSIKEIIEEGWTEQVRKQIGGK